MCSSTVIENANCILLRSISVSCGRESGRTVSEQSDYDACPKFSHKLLLLAASKKRLCYRVIRCMLQRPLRHCTGTGQ